MKEGTEIPEFSVPLTVQRLVMEAAANRDFTPIHHDREFTRATGAPDPYANTMLIQAVLEATLREWMGLAGQLRTLRFNMRAFATAGAIMSGHGRVTRIRTERGGRFVDLDVWTASNGTQTATGSATVWLPTQGPAS
jgi:acyl dehydratase